MKSQAHTLKNGLRVIFVDTAAFPTLTTILLVGAGSRYENKKNNGIAHFFEHMAFKGSKKYLNSYVISSTIEGLGGIFNAFTSKDHTGYWIKATNEHFETMTDVLSDMVTNPLLLEEEITREKGVIVEEINLYEDTPYQKAGELFESLLYSNNPLGFEIAGSKQTVVNFDRKTFTDYMKILYHPKNAVLVVAGGLKKAENYLRIANEKFKDWTNGQKSEFEKVEEEQKKSEVLLKHKKTEQTHFCLGFRAYPLKDKRRYATGLLATILGGGMTSRLFNEIREKRGLCYYIYTGREQYLDVGNFVTRAGVTNNLEKTKEAIEAILNEHKKIAKGEVKEEELKMAKEISKGRMLLAFEDSHNVAIYYGTKLLLEDEVISPQEAIAQIEKVKLDEVVAVASDLFKSKKLNLALIGPFEQKEAFEKTLTL